MSVSLASAAVTHPAIPSDVIWSSVTAGIVLILGLAAILFRGDWRRARGLDKLILLGPPFYGAPLAGFGVEHFTRTALIASIVPAWIPWHRFWAYFVGTCFIAAGLSLATKIQARLAAALLALTFFLFVVLMDAPAWARHLRDWFALTLALRELSFSGGALAFAAGLTETPHRRRADVLATIARCFIAVAVLVFAFAQFMHGDHVPGVPLRPLTPEYVYGHAVWTYLAAVVYAVAGALLLVGKRTRAAATWLGVTVLFVVLVVYVPIGVVERASLDKGFNFLADTLMFGGAVLMLASAMPPDRAQQ